MEDVGEEGLESGRLKERVKVEEDGGLDVLGCGKVG